MALNIKYRPLRAFLHAVETGSFTLGAHRLGVTQPSFTALIQDLESVLDLKLFERTTRSIVLTAAGQELLDRIQRPIADLEEAYRTLQDLAQLRRGMVVLGALPSASLTVVPATLAELRKAHPALQVRVMEAHNDELTSLIRTNQVEFALATNLTESTELAFDPLIHDTFCAVYPKGHPVEKVDRLTWQELVAHELVLLSRGSSARNLFDKALQAKGLQPTLHYDITHMTSAVVLVRQGLGIGVLPRLPLSVLPLGQLRYRPIDEESAKRTIGVVYRKDRHLSPGSRAFIAELKKTVQGGNFSGG